MRQPKRLRVVHVVALSFALLLACRPACAESWRLSVRGADVDLGETPVIAEIDAAIAAGVYLANSAGAAETFHVHVFQDGNRRFLATILPGAARGKTADYTLTKRSAGELDPRQSIAFRPRGPDLLIELDQKPWTAYNVAAGHKPFFFPMIGPTGARYTRAYPMETVAGEDHDHPHQRSCWFTHGNVNGVDFWGEDKKSGTIRETDRSIVVEGPVLGQLATKDDWIGPGEKKVCQDERTVTFYRTIPVRIFDFAIKLHAPEQPVTFHDTKEGMFGLRVASSMDVTRKKGGRIINASGITNEAAWGQASPWVDYIGPVGARTVGIAVFNHPGSFRFPTTWHVRPYGLFAANPFGWRDFGKFEKGDYTIPAGQSIAFRYRVIFHDGELPSTTLDRLFEAYARPPTVVVMKD
jgi:hypothetical protein